MVYPCHRDRVREITQGPRLTIEINLRKFQISAKRPKRLIIRMIQTIFRIGTVFLFRKLYTICREPRPHDVQLNKPSSATMDWEQFVPN